MHGYLHNTIKVNTFFLILYLFIRIGLNNSLSLYNESFRMATFSNIHQLLFIYCIKTNSYITNCNDRKIDKLIVWLIHEVLTPYIGRRTRNKVWHSIANAFSHYKVDRTLGSKSDPCLTLLNLFNTFLLIGRTRHCTENRLLLKSLADL